MSCVCNCVCVWELVCVLVCGLCPLAQVTKQNPVEGLANADSRISLRVEHSAVFCSSSNRQAQNMNNLTSCYRWTNDTEAFGHSRIVVYIVPQLVLIKEHRVTDVCDI